MLTCNRVSLTVDFYRNLAYYTVSSGMVVSLKYTHTPV